jgi:hypothetical protein
MEEAQAFATPSNGGFVVSVKLLSALVSVRRITFVLALGSDICHHPNQASFGFPSSRE